MLMSNTKSSTSSQKQEGAGESSQTVTFLSKLSKSLNFLAGTSLKGKLPGSGNTIKSNLSLY